MTHKNLGNWLIVAMILALVIPLRLHAASHSLLLSQIIAADKQKAPHTKNAPGQLLAEADYDEAYDPFADYSDFDQTAEEEEDENFFHNGRLFTVGLVGGYRGFTNNLASIYSGAAGFGLYICYFFDLRFALQLGFLTSDHLLYVVGPTEKINGNVNMQDISFNLKYYFNTQNVTRGLANLNPYVIGGFSQIYRTITLSGNADFQKTNAFAANIGGGMEIPMLRNKMYFGLQALYSLLGFSDRNQSIVQSDGTTSTGVKPFGDSYTGIAIIGVNF